MRIKFLSTLFFVLAALSIQGISQKIGFDRPAFYSALSSDDIDQVNKQLTLLNSSSFDEKEAYEGALLMKKAGLVSKAKEKLSLFKSGRKKLEASIKKDIDNTEYCFLRLIIQEHAPKMVDYKGQLEHDNKIIRSNFKTLSPVIQQAILDYSKKSKILTGLQS